MDTETSPILTITVCVGSSCYLRGSEQFADNLQRLAQSAGQVARIEFSGAFCMEQCSMGVSIRMGGCVYSGLRPEDAQSFFDAHVLPEIAAGGGQ